MFRYINVFAGLIIDIFSSDGPFLPPYVSRLLVRFERVETLFFGFLLFLWRGFSCSWIFFIRLQV